MSGIGRGRGWLNINKNANTRPGLQEGVENLNLVSSTTPNTNSKYAKLFSIVASYDEDDDGILLNFKLEHFIEVFTKEYNSDEEINDAIKVIYDQCLLDEDFGNKTLIMITAASFQSVVIHDVKIRNVFINKFQEGFEGAKQMQTSNPAAFLNSVKMLGEFYHRLKTPDGGRINFLAKPVLKYLKMLLESNQEIELQLFTRQLYLNGKAIQDTFPLQIVMILNNTRNKLAFNEKLSPTSKLWLMFALDIANNQFTQLPIAIHQFYQQHLGEKAIASIQSRSTKFNIQSWLNSSSKSKINVTQLNSNDSWKENLETEKPEHISTSSNFQNPETSFNNIGTWEQPKNEKLPRPILGAGVRLNDYKEKNCKDNKLKD